MVERGWGDGKDKDVLKCGQKRWSGVKGESEEWGKVPEFGQETHRSHGFPCVGRNGSGPYQDGCEDELFIDLARKLPPVASLETMKQETLLSVDSEETGASEDEGRELTGETPGWGRVVLKLLKY